MARGSNPRIERGEGAVGQSCARNVVKEGLHRGRWASSLGRRPDYKKIECTHQARLQFGERPGGRFVTEKAGNRLRDFCRVAELRVVNDEGFHLMSPREPRGLPASPW